MQSRGLPGAIGAVSAIVFDLDGTLIDSRSDIRTAVNQVREELGMLPLSLDAVVRMVGEGARTLLERALGERFSPAEIDAALHSYLAHYEKVCLEETRPYPGIEDLLEALAPRFPLAVLSNKGEALSRRVLGGLGLAPYFRQILGGDSLPSRKPEPAGLLALAERFEVPVERLLMVGDTWIDAAAAQAVGCSFALAEWGFPQLEQTQGLAADLRIAHPRDLLAALPA